MLVETSDVRSVLSMSDYDDIESALWEYRSDAEGERPHRLVRLADRVHVIVEAAYARERRKS